jgi:hypothetical protein
MRIVTAEAQGILNKASENNSTANEEENGS